MAKHIVCSPVGGKTYHKGSPVVSKPSEDKAADFESPGALGTGEKG